MFVQGLALFQIHCNKNRAARFGVFSDAHDIGVSDLRQDPGFLQEQGQRLFEQFGLTAFGPYDRCSPLAAGQIHRNEFQQPNLLIRVTNMSTIHHAVVIDIHSLDDGVVPHPGIGL